MTTDQLWGDLCNTRADPTLVLARMVKGASRLWAQEQTSGSILVTALYPRRHKMESEVIYGTVADVSNAITGTKIPVTFQGGLK